MKVITWAQALPRKVIWGFAASLILLGLVLIYLGTARPMILVIDGQTYEFRTHARSVLGVLRSAGFEPSADDRVSPQLDDQVTSGAVIHLDHAFPVVIELEERSFVVNSPESSPANILAQADIRLYPGDRVWVDGYRMLDPTRVLEIQPDYMRVDRAETITLEEGDMTRVIHSAAPSLGEALWEGGVVMREGDILSPIPETRVNSSIHAALIRSRSLVINVDGVEIETRAVGPTVGDALSQSGIALVGLDYSRPSVEMLLPENGHIRIVRVQEQIQVELEPLPFDTIYQPAADLELDNLQILDPGNYGVLATRIRVRLEEGQEVGRSIEETWVAVDAEPRVLGYGTRIEVRAVDTPDGRIEYWRAVPVYATSYSPCNLGIDGCNSTTASGKELRRGMIGVIRSWYNMMRGWSVYIPGYGFATIEDIGAGMAGRHWVDLGFTDEEYESWHTWTTLYFIPPVPSLDLIPWILP
ncbi:MAG TPA: DUF348 domain-containing protein [Anaerolineae bacterium]|nr:DUF348 domain-containing protein [Anaerolineae bacterium]